VTRRITIIQGRPDAVGGHLCHALADAYAGGAEQAGHVVRRLEVARLDFPLLRTRAEFETGVPPADIRIAQAAILRAEQLVLVYPLCLGTMPALLKGFLEQTFRPDFAFGSGAQGLGSGRLKGRSARIVVTMGMPAFVYRWYFGGHSLKSLKRNVLGFCGIRPIRTSLFGIETANEARRRRWLMAMRGHGQSGRRRQSRLPAIPVPAKTHSATIRHIQLT
jgi:putative NADPH-quinone reductase